MKPKNGKLYTQKQLLKSVKKCQVCGSTHQEWEHRGESGLQKRLNCLGCPKRTNWYFQSIAAINEWNEE